MLCCNLFVMFFFSRYQNFTANQVNEATTQELTLRLTASFLDRAETGDVTATPLGPKLVGFWGYNRGCFCQG